MATKDVTKHLQAALADSYVTYLMLHNYHWNVVGEDFYAYHGFFEELYKEQLEAIDEVAERIRALGEHVFTKVIDFTASPLLKNIADPYKAKSSLKVMLENLIVAYEAVITQFQKVKQTADKAGDDETVDIAVERITASQKTLWMLRSSLAK